MSCIDRSSGGSVADEKCDQARKPDSRQGCNVKPCGRADTLYRWVHAVTDKCRPVQTGTVRYRNYREVQIKTNRYTHSYRQYYCVDTLWLLHAETGVTDDVLMSLQDGAVILGRRGGGGGGAAVQCSWGPDPGHYVEMGWD